MTMASQAIVWDLDGTIADTQHRHHHIPTPENGRTWWDYAETCSDDEPVMGTITLMRILDRMGFRNIIISARPAAARRDTVSWLSKCDVPHSALHLCPFDVNMRAVEEGHHILMEWKASVIRQLQRVGERFLLAIDDSFAASSTYRQLGIPAITVASPALIAELTKDSTKTIHSQGV